MALGTFLKIFPPPRYLAPRPLGLDISDRSIKYAAFERHARGFKLTCRGEEPLPVETIVGGVIKNAPPLVEALTKIRKTTGYRQAVVALPEEASFAVTMKLPSLAREEIRQGVELQLEEHIPLPAAGVNFDYEIIGRTGEGEAGYRLAVAAFPRLAAEAYLAALAAADWESLACETEAQALGRALIPWGSREAVLVVDLGRWHTGLGLVLGGAVIRSATIAEIGGEAIARALARGLGLTTEAAEKLKVSQGLSGEAGHQEALFAILPLVSVLRDEIAKFVRHWSEEDEAVGQAARLILAGGEAALPGLRDYFQQALTLPVVLGNPWTNAPLDPKAGSPPPLNESLRYATALGLALRPFAEVLDHHD
jgi:type IV pilus assembly protein PilM